MRRIISVLIENEPGALSRVVGLFSQRGYNIDSLAVAPTDDLSLSRMTIITRGDDQVLEQITKHLNRLIEVVKLNDLTDGSHIEREIMMIKLRTTDSDKRDEVYRMAEIFRGQIIDVTNAIYTVQLTGTSDKLDAFIEALEPSWILEVVRTGAVGISRGEKTLSL
jgi:acetolactate synthase-1/3 small subunit|tara:strand:+ start:2147 stop:2641 length:495 start_codon:yes stop_codon:yes gene_type:complete